MFVQCLGSCLVWTYVNDCICVCIVFAAPCDPHTKHFTP